MSKYRIQRVNSEFQKALTGIIGRLKDPRLTDMVSVTRVDVDQDLKNGKVYLSIFSADQESKQANLEAIASGAGFIRRELAREIPHIRQIPSLTYHIDDSLDYSDKINKIISGLNSGGGDKETE